MNHKSNKKPRHHPQTNPAPKTAVSDPSLADVASTKPTKHDAVVAEQSTKKPAGKKGTEMEKIRWTDIIIATATVVIAFATIVQGCEMVTGSGDTHKLAESTLAASRAWVVVQGTGFGFTQDKNFPTGRVILADSGESPAFRMEGWRCVEVRADEPPIQNGALRKSNTGICLPIAGGTLGKGVPVTMDAFVPAIVPDGFAKDTEGIGPHFYFWGTVTYDIYPDDGKRHTTSFCLRNGGSQLSACKEGGYQTD
jgi:hypothetical protein